MQPVLTKRDFVRRYVRGEFGNRAPTWNTLAEFQASGYRLPVHIRNRVAGGPTWYNVPSGQAVAKFTELVQSGIDPKSLYISGMAPHDRGTIQGEVQQTHEHLELSYCSAKLPMRDSMLLWNKRATGVEATVLLKEYMDASSYDWINELLDRYPGHVIEFSCFEIPWGTIPNRNTIVWEVRKY